MVEELRNLRRREYTRYFETDRSKKLIERLGEFAEHAEDCLAGGGSRRRVFAIVGESGSGKSTSLSRAFKTVAAFQPYRNELGETVRPLISMNVPKPCSRKDLAIDVLDNVGISASRKANEHELFKIVKQQLRHQKVVFLHLDEAQDLLSAPTTASVRALQDSLKALIAIDDWPLHLILSGVPDLAQLFIGDRQLANRSLIMRFENWSFPADKKRFSDVFDDVAVKNCGMSLAATLLTDDFIGRLAKASRGAVGDLIDMVRDACFSALSKGRNELQPRDFLKVYARQSGSRQDDNIMKSAAWTELAPENSLIDLATSGVKKQKREATR
ncbi:ATP-binding protein [Rhizobium leguminosarum]|uniref:ATP-binding protein n=1 Tax=Rhizobium leguminosarum TaxID=384 RepID=UPI00037FFB1C|nr:ATP-binding protein [Rhizobium leguminosarum]